MSNTYECMVLVDNQEVRKGWANCKQGIVDLFTKHEAEILSARRWEERRLAYPIKGQQRATYLLVYFKGKNNAPAAIRRELDFQEAVLRHMILACEAVPADAFEPEVEFDETKAGEEPVRDQGESSSAPKPGADGGETDSDSSDNGGSDEESEDE